MIDKRKIEEFLELTLKEKGMFLVQVQTGPGNIFRVYVDKPEGITIRECSDVSRMITSHFDREVEDYSLDVSSPGLDMPLLVPGQFEKNISREVTVELKEGEKHKGILKSFDGEGIVIEEKKRIKEEGKKNKQDIIVQTSFKFIDIKTVKVVISFK